MDKNSNWKNRILWLLVAGSFSLNGTLMFLGYQSIVERLDRIERAVSEVPVIETQVEGQGRTLDRHEAKLDELQKNKADKPGP